MARYIDVDIAVREAINACNKLFREKGEFLTSLDAVEIAEALDDIPAADVEEVNHAYWEEHVEKGNCFEHTYYICTNCGVVALDEDYEIRCHHCGAKMDGGRKNDRKG